MKNTIYVFLSALLFMSNSLVINAQIREITTSMSQGSNNALAIDILYADPEKVLDEFEDYVENFKAKTKKKKGELFGDNAQIKSIGGNNTIDVYAKAEKGDNKSILTVWFDLGGAYLSSKTHGEKYGEAVKWLNDFASRMVKKNIEDELKAEQKKLETLTDEQKELVRSKEKLDKSIIDSEKDIKDLEAKIAQTKQNIEKAKQDIITNQEKQKDKTTDIEKQKEVVKKVEAKLKGM
jgi:hypothetical protein